MASVPEPDGVSPAGEDRGAGMADAPCRQCLLPMPRGAKLCSRCGSYQDWRGSLSVSNSVLALLVALVSVSSLALPAISGALRSHRSQVAVSNPVFEGEQVLLVATNVGERPGIVRRAELRSDLIGTQADLELRSAVDAFVPPGSRQVGFRIVTRRSALDTAMQMMKVASVTIAQRQDAVGVLTVWSEQSNGTTTSRSFSVRRIDLMNLLDAHRVRCEAVRSSRGEDGGCRGLDDLARDVNDHVDATVARLQGRPR